jgi:tRNA dimethylallyltransferase
VGKTQRSVALAQDLGAEIISCDSRQVYRGLDIGTAKPSAEELAAVRHHFIDELDIGEAWTAGRFAREAEERIVDILGRGRTALVVGGSTLYLEALVHGMSEVPAAPSDVRQAVSAQAATPEGRAGLMLELRAADPVTADSIDQDNPHRLARAIEVLRATGRPISEFRAAVRQPAFSYDVEVLAREPGDLRQRINRRVDVMLSDGLVEENRRLKEAGVDRNLAALQTIGYREPMAFLAGEITEDEMVQRLKQNTWQYARRQLTWFRRHPEYRWTPLDADEQ